MQQSLFANALAQAEPVVQSSGAMALDTPLSETIFTVLDVETTGLSPKKNSLTEITAIQFKNGEEISKFSTLVKPAEEIPPEVETLTGITNEMVQQAPSLIQVMTELCSFSGPSPLVVGHNVGFDIRFLQEKLQQSGMASLQDRFDLQRAFCTRALALKALPGLPSYEGVVVATQCGVYNPNPHRAEYDVRMSAGILFELIRRLQADEALNLKTAQDLLDYQGPLS
jgi:DNA polymerase III epsilon subunit family exonuclease